MSFKLPGPAPKKHRGRGSQIAFRLPDDLVEPFRKAFDASGLSLVQFVSAMIRHSLKDLEPKLVERIEKERA